MEAKHPLETYREAQHLSRFDLAKVLGISPVTLFRWEKGTRQPNPKKLSDITEKTGIPAKELRPDLVEKLGASQ
jgi:transcriptional regulator with XRE-family HTH domain